MAAFCFCFFIYFAAFSNFRILIGDVELGQRPELLDVAALPLSQVFAYVTEDRQTAVVSQSSRIRLDWLRWVREVLGGSASEATYTVYRTRIDESGDEVGFREALPSTPADGSFRIIVNISPGTNEFYVEILNVVLVVGAEDPDSAIYELEACLPQPDGSEECFSSNITVYPIGEPPVLVQAGDDGKILTK